MAKNNISHLFHWILSIYFLMISYLGRNMENSEGFTNFQLCDDYSTQWERVTELQEIGLNTPEGHLTSIQASR